MDEHGEICSDEGSLSGSNRVQHSAITFLFFFFPRPPFAAYIQSLLVASLPCRTLLLSLHALRSTFSGSEAFGLVPLRKTVQGWPKDVEVWLGALDAFKKFSGLEAVLSMLLIASTPRNQ
jgi:hypothetical protein